MPEPTRAQTHAYLISITQDGYYRQGLRAADLLERARPHEDIQVRYHNRVVIGLGFAGEAQDLRAKLDLEETCLRIDPLPKLSAAEEDLYASYLEDEVLGARQD